MIEVSGIRVALSRLDGTDACELTELYKAASRKLGVRTADIRSLTRCKRSVDARKRSAIQLTYTLRVTLKKGERQALRCAGRSAHPVSDEGAYALPKRLPAPSGTRPVIVGAGCAGLFCALALASAGLSPLLVERGDDAERRSAAVRAFADGGALDPESNIQFGLGGAGTFSDGKLSTGTTSPAHRLILQTLVNAGAAKRILWDGKPHVGSDVLPGVVTRIVRRIEELGGEVQFRTRLRDLEVTGGRIRAITLEADGREERIVAEDVVLACGHSARDVFELLQRAGVALERKTFAMGVRIEHLQADIDRALLGASAGHPALGAASYKLAVHPDEGRSAFSFCMCPGGTVVAAASEPGGVVTNGASDAARAGSNANAGLLANVFPNDLPGDDVLAGVELQRACEQAAYQRAGGTYAAPAQLVGDFLAGRPSEGAGSIVPTYPRGVAWGTLEGCLPPYVLDALHTAIPLMERKLPGFSTHDGVLTGVESRSSSPVRVTRDESGQALGIAGLWPCGEGAGYAGGIMSAATDGLRCAENLVRRRRGDL